MRHVFLIALVFVLSVTVLTAQKRTTVALLDLGFADKIPQSVSATLSNLIRQEFLKSKQYEILDRNNMSTILKEQDFSLSDACSGKECAVQVGKLLAVEKMIYGTISLLGKKYIINLQMVDVTTGKIEKIENENYIGAIEDIDAAAVNAAKKIIGEEKIEASININYSLYVVSEPEGARVFLDDSPKGNTPLTLSLKTENTVTLLLKAPNYQDWTQDVTPKKGEKTIVDAKMLPKETGFSMDSKVRLYDIKSKSHKTALYWSLFMGLAGAGNFYAGQTKMALGVIALNITGFALASKGKGGTSLVALSTLGGMIGAQFGVLSHNKQLRRDLDISVIPDVRNRGAQLVFSVVLK